MGIHLIPFAAGLAVGALATYGSRDETVRKEVKDGAAWLTSGAERLYGSVVGGVSSLIGLGRPRKPAAPTRRRRSKAAQEAAATAPAKKRTRARKTAGTATAGKRASARPRRKTAKAEST